METILFMNVKNIILVPKASIIFYLTKEEHWIFPKPKYDTHTMAMMLIDILHEQNVINDATYRKIHMKYKKQEALIW